MWRGDYPVAHWERRLSGAPYSFAETWVVSEIAKYRTNRGETAGLSFYRDRNGAEADLIIEHPSRITLVEAKVSETPSSTLLAGARRVQRHLSR